MDANKDSSVGVASKTSSGQSNPTSDNEILNLYGVQSDNSDYTMAKRALQMSHSLGGDSVVSIMSSADSRGNSPVALATAGVIDDISASPPRASLSLETKEARACVAKLESATDLAVATKDLQVILIHIFNCVSYRCNKKASSSIAFR